MSNAHSTIGAVIDDRDKLLAFVRKFARAGDKRAQRLLEELGEDGK